jgi:PadR family transcriptional regulator, regulatory protein AphA
MKRTPATEYALLGTLLSGPMHGYEILQFLNNAFDITWYVSISQLYVLLKKLERDGLVTSTMQAQDTRPSKRVFSLTQAGSNAFLSWLHTPSQHVRDLRIEFLAKLFFFQRFSLEGAEELIEAQVRILERSRNVILNNQETTKDSYKKLVFGFKLATVNSWLQWLRNQARPFVEQNRNRFTHKEVEAEGKQ